MIPLRASKRASDRPSAQSTRHGDCLSHRFSNYETQVSRGSPITLQQLNAFPRSVEMKSSSITTRRLYLRGLLVSNTHETTPTGFNVYRCVFNEGREVTKLENPRTQRLHARRTFSRMAPRKPDTMESLPLSTRPEIGRGEPTAPVYHRCYLATYVLPPTVRLYESFIETILPSLTLPLYLPPSTGCYALFPRFASILTASLITGAIRVGRFC